MKQSLRKTSFGLYMEYGFTHTNNLHGEHLTLETTDDTKTLFIDLSANLRVRNKHTNTYLDADDICRRHDELTAVELGSELVLPPLGKNVKSGSKFFLILSFGDRGQFRYQITPHLDRTVRLAVLKNP